MQVLVKTGGNTGLVSGWLRDDRCPAWSCHGPTSARHGRPVGMRMPQVTRRSWQQLWGVVYNGSDGWLQELTPSLGSDSWWTWRGSLLSLERRTDHTRANNTVCTARKDGRACRSTVVSKRQLVQWAYGANQVHTGRGRLRPPAFVETARGGKLW